MHQQGFPAREATMKILRGIVTVVLALGAVSAIAQQGPVLFFGIMELSGTGATPGTNFDNGVAHAPAWPTVQPGRTLRVRSRRFGQCGATRVTTADSGC